MCRNRMCAHRRIPSGRPEFTVGKHHEERNSSSQRRAGMAFREKVLETHHSASDPTAAVSFGP